jgi:hypothetical protein
MKRAIAILTLSVLVAPVVAAAQGAQTQQPASPTLAEVAKAEEARRKSVRKPAKVYTNDNLKPDNGTVRPAPPAPDTTVPAVNLPGGTAAQPAPDAAPDPASEAKGQAYWSGRMKAAQAALDRSRVFAESLQSRINALTTDFVNRDDPAQRAQIETNRKAALAELDRVKLEIEAQQKAIAAIEEEARRAGVPSGWLRQDV